MSNTTKDPKVIHMDEAKDSNAFDSGVKMQLEPVGVSGTDISGGYFREDHLAQLRGKRGAKVFDEMARSESQISMILNGIMNPIKSAEWAFEAARDVEGGDVHAELMETIFKKGLDWETFLHEALTFLKYGYSPFEVVHSVVLNHEKFGNFNGLKALAFRSPKTIERWILDQVTGSLKSIEQYSYTDLGKENHFVIPGEFVLLFSHQKEGDNYEGISILRAMYGPWFRKNLYLKIAAIGAEKNAVGTPIATIPSGKEKSPEYTKLKEILKKYTVHQSAFITIPEGWKITFEKGEFDADKLEKLLVYEDKQMVNAVVANFLALGMSGGGGSFALGTDLSDFFLTGIQCYANLICGVVNRQLIPQLIKMNYGEQASYPTLKCTGINDKAGKELSEIIVANVSAGVLKADDKLEKFVRKSYNMPEADPATARVAPAAASPYPAKPAPAAAPVVQAQLSETRIQLTEKYLKTFDKHQVAVKDLMQSSLKTMLQGMKDKIARDYKNATANQKKLIAANIAAPGVSKYRQDLRELLAQVAMSGLDSARSEIPNGNKIKLAEVIRLAAPKGGYYAALPPKIRAVIQAQSQLIATTQVADIEKRVAFSYFSSQASTEEIDQILTDIEESTAPIIEGSTAAGTNIEAAATNATAQALNEARMEFFFDKEVFDSIESFTFVNEDPVSKICKYLDGTTLAAQDPQVSRLATPLHHNCKSRWVPNIKGDKGNPEIETGPLSIPQDALDSMTLCECDHTYSLVARG